MTADRPSESDDTVDTALRIVKVGGLLLLWLAAAVIALGWAAYGVAWVVERFRH